MNENKCNNSSSKVYEIEHKYIDFTHTIIGDKIKDIDNMKDNKIRRFDDIYFA